MAVALVYKLTTTYVTSSRLCLVRLGLKARLLAIIWDSAHSQIVSDTWWKAFLPGFCILVVEKSGLEIKHPSTYSKIQDRNAQFHKTVLKFCSIKSQVNKIIRIKAEFGGLYADITIKIFRDKTKDKSQNWPLQIKKEISPTATSCLKDLSCTKSVQNPCGSERDRGFPAKTVENRKMAQYEPWPVLF